MALLDDFKTRFPQFDPAEVDLLWPQIEALLPCLYGGEYGAGSPCVDNAILYLAAHLFVTISDGQEAPAMGAVSEAVGPVSVTNIVGQSPSNRNSFLNSTGYGQTYLILIEKRQGAFFV